MKKFLPNIVKASVFIYKHKKIIINTLKGGEALYRLAKKPKTYKKNS